MQKNSTFMTLLKQIFLVALGYYATGRLGLAFPYGNSNVSLIWLPAGIAVAALIRWGNGMTVAIFLASFLLSSGSGLNVGASVALALGNTLGPYLCCWILLRQKFSASFPSRKHVAWFSFSAALGMMAAATGGSLGFWYQGLDVSHSVVWFSWWAGDTIGVLLAAPLLLSWSRKSFSDLASRRIAAITFESQEGIFVADGQWKILRLNQAFSRITGFSTDELIGQPVLRLTTKLQDQAFFENIDAALQLHKFWQGELWSKRKNGETFPQMITLTAIADERGRVNNYIGSFTDISRHKGYEEEIRNLAFYDPLTQLPNRRLLVDRLQHLISIRGRNDSHSAVLFIDLDNFKTLNDTRGHDAGDLLLIEAANRLQTCVRDSDTVARLGGDEFVVILEQLSNVLEDAISQADRVSEKIRLLLSEPYQIMDLEHHASGSIGVCLFSGADNTVKDLFKRADTAMYEAKTSGRNAVRFFDPAMQAVLVVRMMLESNLRVALALEQFQLYYQVQVNAEGKLIGAEALLRWIHPDRGFIPPAEFISLAEETGLIVPIGLWVMNTACAQLKKWEGHADTQHMTLAVNVSAKQFQQADFVDSISNIVRKHQIDPTRLKIELTESTILDNVDDTTEKMHQLKKLGIFFSMDDFGTGYSSLAYLQRLPLNQLKIDQSFVRDISDDENDATIVRAIISLGINLGLNVIAEGVETSEQRRFLIAHNCFAFQGYLFSKPVPIEGLQALFLQPESSRIGRNTPQ